MKLRHGYIFWAFPLTVEHRNQVRKIYRRERRSSTRTTVTGCRMDARNAATDYAMWAVVHPHLTELGITPDAPDFLRPGWTPEAAA